MIFVILSKWRKKPTKEMLTQSEEILEKRKKEGIKYLGTYWTLGRYDSVAIAESKDEKTAMKGLLEWGDMLSTETLVAVTREEAIKLLE